MIAPLDYNPAFNQDLFILIGGTVFLLLAMFTGKRKRLDRWKAGLLVGAYVAYTVYLVVLEL